jgi:hypothetical protein
VDVGGDGMGGEVWGTGLSTPKAVPNPWPGQPNEWPQQFPIADSGGGGGSSNYQSNNYHLSSSDQHVTPLDMALHHANANANANSNANSNVDAFQNFNSEAERRFASRIRIKPTRSKSLANATLPSVPSVPSNSSFTTTAQAAGGSLPSLPSVSAETKALYDMVMSQQQQMQALQMALKKKPTTTKVTPKKKESIKGGSGRPKTSKSAANQNTHNVSGESRTFRLFVWDGKSKSYLATTHRFRGREPGSAAKKSVQKGATQFVLTEKTAPKEITAYFYLGERIPINQTKTIAGKQVTIHSKPVINQWKRAHTPMSELQSLLAKFPPPTPQ